MIGTSWTRDINHARHYNTKAEAEAVAECIRQTVQRRADCIVVYKSKAPVKEAV